MSQKNLTSEEWKDRGNAAFSKKDYEDALTAYGSAIGATFTLPMLCLVLNLIGIASCSDEEASKKRVHIYYSNRAAVYLALQRYLLALEDATMAIRANSEWAKVSCFISNSIGLLTILKSRAIFVVVKL